MSETTPATSTEQLLVQVLLRSLDDALRSDRGEGPLAEHPERARDAVSLAFVSVSNRVPWLTIEVTEEGLVWNDVVVLRAGEDGDELLELLRSARIERLDMVRGAEAELPRFVSALERIAEAGTDPGADLTTLLFREDLQYIRYATQQPEKESGSRATPGAAPEPASDPVPPATATPASVLDAVRAEAAAHRTGPAAEPESVDSSLYFLDQEEIAYLREAIELEYETDHARSVVDMLLDVLESQDVRQTRDEVLDVLRTLLPYLLGLGRFDLVAHLTAEMRALGRRLQLDTEHARALEALRTSVSETRALAQLFHAFDTETLHPTDADLATLLHELRPEAIGTVLVWVSQLTNPTAKGVVQDALRSFFVRWPHSLALLLDASDKTVVHRALGIAETLALPDLVEPLSRAVEADDPVTRIRAIRALTAIGTPAAIRLLTPLVDDPDEDVRLRVLEELAARPVRVGLGPLQRALGSSDLEQRDVSERRALMRAYAAASGPAAVMTLEPVLEGRGGLARRPSSETRACAAVALGALATPAARAALAKAATDRDPVVRSAANSALRALQ